MNIFEGARRITKIIAGIAVICTVAAAMIYKPYISREYVYDKERYLKPIGSCNFGDDRYYPKVVGLPDVTVTVCGHSTGPSEVELSNEEIDYIRYEIVEKKTADNKEKAGWLLGFLSVGWALTWAIGWIIRGFMGIPRGHDKRPAPSQLPASPH